MKEWLFSYGTLQNEETQKKIFGRILKGTADTLSGYSISTIEIKDENFLSKGEQKYQHTAIASKYKNDNINGTVFEITGDELLLTDIYEPDGYTRIKVMLASGKKAWIYVAVENI